MNHTYRLIWNDTLQCQVPAPENAHSRGKRTGLKPLAAAMLAAFACNAYALPTGGAISAGAGSIAQSSATMTVSQSTQNLAINWQSFGIAANEAVNFNQPNASAIALNRVLGSDPSQILGQLNANGQVWVLNPNGVLFGRTAQVNTGGLVASTLNISDADFLAGKRTFTGSGGSVINQGALNATGGGYVALLGGQVSNEGIVTARLGTVALAAGDKVTLDFNGDQLLNVQVEQGALDALAQNSQLIRADGGTVLMTAKAADALATAVVNNTGIIEARGIENHNGVIKLLGDMDHGTVNVGGTLDASAPNGGDGGFVETSAAHVRITDGAVVTTRAEIGQSGTWLIDPVDFTIAASGGDMTGAALGLALAGGNVAILSTSGGAGTAGDVNVNDVVSWNANKLTLNAQNNININANLNASGTGSLALEYGQGAVAAGNTSNYYLGNGAKVNLPAGNNFSTKLGSNGATTPWTVITALGAAGSVTGTDLQGMNGNLAGNYVLGANIDASATSGWNAGAGFTPVGTNAVTSFTGKFDGLGHTISGLKIDLSSGNLINYGMFGDANNAVLQNVGLLNVNIKGGSNGMTGALAGAIRGTTAVRNCYVDGGSVSTATLAVGGLVGAVYNPSTISYSYANVSVSAGMGGSSGQARAGGLVGANLGTISYSYATGSVSAPANNTASTEIGGLVGIQTNGSISNSYATGAVSGFNTLGGLVGNLSGGSAPTGSYWDKTTTGQNSSVGSGTAGGTGLTTDQWTTLGPIATGAWSSTDWGTGYPYPGLKTLPYITITASASQTYGSAATFGIASILDQTGANATGLVNTGGLTWSAGTTASTAAGTTSAVRGTGATGTGYQILYAGNLTVGQAPLTVTANNASKTYDGLAYSGGNGVSYSGFVNGEGAGILGGTLAYGGTSQGAINAGGYNITPSGLTSSNYAISYVDGTLTINKAHLTVTADNQTRLYGQANPAFSQTISGYVNGENATSANVTGSATGSSAANATSGVGNYAITGSTGTLAAANYDFTAADGVLTINKAHLTVTADNQTRLYGQANPAFSQTISGYVNGENATTANVTGSATGSSTATAASGVGNYAITGSTGTLAAANYDFTAADGVLTINKAHLTVTADNQTRLYGQANPAFSQTISGYVNGENATSAGVTGTATGSSTATATSGVGNYAITGSTGTLAAANYDFTAADGVLTINKAHLTVTADNQTRLYGQANPAFSQTISGYVNGENATSAGVTGTATGSSTATATSGVGNYAITGSTGTLAAANYDFTAADGVLTINKAHLTVTADNQTRLYGQANPAFSQTISGYVNGENATSAGVTGTATGSSTATATSGVGNYAIAGSTGTLNAANYDFTAADGVLTINRAHLTVTADNQTRLYGQANPAFSQTISGYVNGENATTANVTGSATGSSTATAASGVGNYAITGSTGTLAAANYDFAAADGVLTINKAHLTVTADNQSRLYGQVNPAFSQTITGYVNGENATSAGVTGTATGSSAATATTGVGNYVIAGSTGTLNAANYDFTAADGVLTINKAHLTVTADNQTRLYGQVNPAFSQTISGYVNGENATSAGVTGTAMGSSAATATSGVGNYAITGSTGTLAAANYDFTAANGTLTVNPALLTVTANNAIKPYDGIAWSGGNGVSYSGFVNGETSAVLGGALVYGGSSQGAVGAGNYAIIPGGLTAANYAISFNGGTLSIGQRLPVIPGVPADSYAGATNAAHGEGGNASAEHSSAVAGISSQFVLVTQDCGLHLPDGLSCQ